MLNTFLDITTDIHRIGALTLLQGICFASVKRQPLSAMCRIVLGVQIQSLGNNSEVPKLRGLLSNCSHVVNGNLQHENCNNKDNG
jgi:hypothetical protein